MDNKPAIFISWPMAARYCNWLHNKVSNINSTNNTNGVYNFDGSYYDGGLGSNSGLNRSSDAKYFLPTVHEWYKSAYYTLNTSNADIYTYSASTITSNSATITTDIPAAFAKTLSLGQTAILDDQFYIRYGNRNQFSEITGVKFVYCEGGCYEGTPGTYNIYIDQNILTPDTTTSLEIVSAPTYTGYFKYHTQSNLPPACIETDEYGEGPRWVNDVKKLVFDNLSVGDSYTVYLSITKPSKYDAFLNTSIINFKPYRTSETILVPITRYSTVLAIILTAKLVKNNGQVIDERTHLIACPKVNTSCFARIPRTPLPTITVTPSVTVTNSLTPTKTKIPVSPSPTPTVTKTITPTISITPTITPTVTVTSTKAQSTIYACNFVDIANDYNVMSGTYNKQTDTEYRKDNNPTGYKIYYNISNSRWELSNHAGTAFYYSSSLFGTWRSTAAITQYPTDSIGFWEVSKSVCVDRDTFL